MTQKESALKPPDSKSLCPAPVIKVILGLQLPTLKNLINNYFRLSGPFQRVRYFIRLFSDYSTPLCLFLLRSSQQMQMHHGRTEYFKQSSKDAASSSKNQWTKKSRW